MGCLSDLALRFCGMPVRVKTPDLGLAMVRYADTDNPLAFNASQPVQRNVANCEFHDLLLEEFLRGLRTSARG